MRLNGYQGNTEYSKPEDHEEAARTMEVVVEEEPDPEEVHFGEPTAGGLRTPPGLIEEELRQADSAGGRGE